MSLEKNRLSRWLGRGEATQVPQPLPISSEPGPIGADLYLLLDDEGRIQSISPHLLSRLDIAAPLPAAQRLMSLLLPNSALVIEGVPRDWLGHMLDLDFKGDDAHTLHARGWVQAHGKGWLLQLLDISDLMEEASAARSRQQCLRFAGQMAERVRGCNVDRLTAVVSEQLEELAQLWRIPCVALVLPEVGGVGWRVYCQYSAHTAPELWQVGQRLGTALDRFNVDATQQLRFGGSVDAGALQSVFGNADGFLIPHSRDNVAKAWLMFGFYNAQQQAPDLGEREWLNLCSALAGPVLFRMSEQHNRHHVERLAVLQDLLGTGWWELLPDRDEVLLAPQLARSLRLGDRVESLSRQDWLALIHPADRQELSSRLAQLRDKGTPLLLCVRLAQNDPAQETLWFRIQGQALHRGQVQRVLGFMLDVSDIKNQETEAAAAHARLDNLIASSPAVIYVQRYDHGNLEPTFFSDSLTPLLGWTLADCVDGQLAGYIHPDDHDIWFERNRQLLREGFVSRRFRLRNRNGQYHWLLDEARLLRDDLGMPVEAVGLWLDVTEATLAAEHIRRSEERYRILVEDSPAMICRYTPDLVLSFGNRPLAKYMECTPEQLTGINLGDWLSDEQREAFIKRIGQLTPEAPVSTEEICIELPGREYAWWIWADRGVFDEHGKLVEVQAVGRDNTDVRRSRMQLNQSAKMATLGEMSTGLAHEINQPLNVMRMAVVNVLKRLGRGDVDIEYLTEKLNRIDTQVQRAARVVDHMRVFGRRSEVEEQLFDPAQAVEGTISMLAEGMKGKGVQLRVGEMIDAVRVRGHVDQLEQVLINLMVNARDALLSRREKDRDFEPWISVEAQRDENIIRLAVQDNGGGIDPRLLERIFEPFFTTKPVGVGTGLGLSVSYGIVDQMGGQLSVANIGEGARFQIELPIFNADQPGS
ncbi:PAS domain-containing sensor histidine kinase [Pseudomonas syringae]|uniref:PAS domain-containing sensor histidine kinase n=1 Tax=Pseudomonas syringae TaxID=317 RepID=UPI0015E2D3D0|nr:PAS domain-containing sensor histidine kinase [Pseudomonas syringae]MCH5513273.1 PAS domain-containing protein [Pseudomonas syringae pv. syringae]MCH5557274.1 PAS domain-containing protein [Pseudomonas syringae pv. syringae]MCH5575419.1 PAS domain-containing protein [Pseudomonas syringae pv. syringae]MCH5626489.1 PAS domain-containing protein [Pseudomonas syringae pv. syringae]MCH5667687.1 PAS domain-containing protein [Pseudomonas syringae pv. syringae]